MACDNIYSRCIDKSTVRRAEKSAESDETAILLEKLSFIRDFVTDLKDIAKNAKPRDPVAIKGDATALPAEGGAAAGAALASGGKTGGGLGESSAGSGRRGAHGSSGAPPSSSRGAGGESRQGASRHSVSTTSEDPR